MHSFPLRASALLALCWLIHLPADAQVASYNEFSFPNALALKPGVTRITGGITASGQTDRFYFLPSAGGTLVTRVTYTHRSGNILAGITEWAHLDATLASGVHAGGDAFLSFDFTPLSSPFYIQDAANTIRLTQVVDDFEPSSGSRQLSVSAPPGKVNPGYTIELEYTPAPDSFDTAGGNESAATAVLRDPRVPGRVAGNIAGPTDVDWFRFDVPAGKSLRVQFEDLNLASTSTAANASELQPLRSEILNAQGIPLQITNSNYATFQETAGPSGATYYLRVSPQDEYASPWRAAWVLEDSLEPNNSSAAARDLGTLAPGGRLEIPDLTVLDADYYTFLSTLPAGTPIVAAAIPYGKADPMGGQRLRATAGATITHEMANYAVFTTGTNGTVTLVVTGGPHRYRLLVKPQSAYDLWQQNLSLEENAQPPYLAAESDDDGDGLPAALERALGTSPFSAVPNPISAPYFDGSVWRVNVAMPQGGSSADIRVEESIDLSSWTPLDAARGNFGGSVIPAGRSSGAVITLTRAGEARNFLRFGADD
jgi:hypothetical protein